MPLPRDLAIPLLDINQRNSQVLSGGVYENVHWNIFCGSEELWTAKVTITVAYTTVMWYMYGIAYHATVKCNKMEFHKAT